MNSGTLTSFYCQQHGHKVEDKAKIDDGEYEDLYMPSEWVRRVPVKEAVPLHIKIVSDESARIRHNVSGRLALRYGDGDEDLIDVFGESGHSGVVVVYVSGGYWQEMSGSISAYTVGPLLEAGITVVVVDYSRAPRTDMGGIVGQIERAGRWIVRYASERNARVWLTGHSAGSHLCAMLVSSPWYHALPTHHKQVIRGVIHLSGIFDLKPILRTSVNKALGMSVEEAEKFSPLNLSNLGRLCDQKHLHHYIVTGEWDSPAFQQQAMQYSAELMQRGMAVVTCSVAGEDHFSLVERLMEDQYSLTRDIIDWITLGN